MPGAPRLRGPARGRELDHCHREGASVRRRRAHRLGSPAATEQKDVANYEAVPCLLRIESGERHCEWLRRAEHPELPGCVAEAPSAVEALEALERERLRVLRRLWDGGSVIPVPRPPLRDPRTAPSYPAA